MAFDPSQAASKSSGIFGLESSPDTSKVVILPVGWEPTTSYGQGTASAPQAILRASHQIDLFDVETGRPYERGIAMLDERDDIRRWNEEASKLARPIIDQDPALSPAERDKAIQRVNELGTQLNDAVTNWCGEWIQKDRIVGVVGGDHSVAFGAIRAAAAARPGIGVLHIDAHADLRVAYEGFEHSHASVMRNVVDRIPNVAKLVQVGVRDLAEEEFNCVRATGARLECVYGPDLMRARASGRLSKLFDEIARELPPDVYISFDIDGLDPSSCPNTGTPVPGGLSFDEACLLIATIERNGHRIEGFDLTEVAPDPSGTREWDANVGARVLYKLIGWTLLSQGIGNAPR